MNLVEVGTENFTPTWHLDSLERFGSRVLDALKIDNWEVSVLLCDDKLIQELNRTYRSKDEATDVLSFALYADGGQNDFCDTGSCGTITAGDIIISMETLERQAAEFNISCEEELKRLMIHGILHLTGMDHKSNVTEEEEMLMKQEQLMSQFAGEKIF